MKSLVYKPYIQYCKPILKNPIKYISCAFALLGAFYTVCEIEQNVFRSQILLDYLRNNIIPVFIVIIIITILVHREKAEFSSRLGEKDYSITLKIADLLGLKNSAIVIPTNTTFDTTTNDDFISEKSVQGQFQKKFYGVDFAELDKLLQVSLDEQYPNTYIQLNDRTQTKRKRYSIGTVSKITKGKTHYYFLAIADVNKRGKSENVTMQSLTQALVGLWSYLSKEGHSEPITIPVIGTGRAGLKDGNIEDVIHETIFSFVSTAQEEFVAKGLTICIYPPALKDANVCWDDLCDYLKLQCCYATENEKRRKVSVTSGNPAE
ncbi:MAG: DUF6430 domain-containing protein [Dysgonamonadaceae bacterium]|nr:DUF6430 domain-containing protein [Dysgonamonadaceae bacterium]